MDCANLVVSLPVIVFGRSVTLNAIVHSHTLLQLLPIANIIAKGRHVARISLMMHLLLLERRNRKRRPIW